MTATPYPRVGVWMAIAGGILMIIEGISLGGVFAAAPSIIPAVLLAALADFGVWAIINGIIVIVFAAYIAYNPMSSYAAYGVLIFASISFVFLGGYFLGGILGIVGSSWVLSWQTYRPGMPAREAAGAKETASAPSR